MGHYCGKIFSVLATGLLLTLQFICCLSSLQIEITSLKHELVQPEIFDIFRPFMMTYKGRNVIHLDMQFRQSVPAFDVHIAAILTRTNKPLMNITLDGCAGLVNIGQGDNKLLQMILKSLKSGNSSVPEKCPLEGGKLIVIDRFALDPEKFPPFTPAMNVLVKFDLLIKKKAAFLIRLNLEVTRT